MMWRLSQCCNQSFHYAIANVEDEAHLDGSVQGFWGTNCHHRAFYIDIRIFNLTAPIAVTSLYRRFECDKQQMQGCSQTFIRVGSF